jgi:general secretion pathway protein A
VYESFYGLREKPFTLTPNPRYVFYSDSYQAALEQLLYAIEQREGFLLLTGPVGTGKTTLCRELLEKLDPQRYRSALIFNPFLSPQEMLEALLDEFEQSYPDNLSRKGLLDHLNSYLLSQLAAGYTCVAIFDEAQHHSPEFLEHIRVLSNLETEREKLIQILLVGQPELRQRIHQPSLAQLDQRVSVRCELRSLSLEETERYIYHRLNVAGAHGRITFTPRAIEELYKASQGIPRLINLLADRTLLAGYAAQTRKLTHRHVEKAINALRGELQDGRRTRKAAKQHRRVRPLTFVLLAIAVLEALAASWYWYFPDWRPW